MKCIGGNQCGCFGAQTVVAKTDWTEAGLEGGCDFFGREVALRAYEYGGVGSGGQFAAEQQARNREVAISNEAGIRL